MDDVAVLFAIERIKQLKARYFRAMDTKNWSLLEQVFTEDVVCDFSGALHDPDSSPPPTDSAKDVVRGRDAVLRYISEGLSPIRSVHHGHMPEIEIDGPDAASAIWAMYDGLLFPGGPLRELHGYGHYHETYRRTDGKWSIATLRLTRLRVQTIPA